jgi:hypothetical protein
MRKIIVTAALAIVGLSACEKAISEPEGPLTGTWHYRAENLLFGAHTSNNWRCTVDVRLDVVQDGNVLQGQTRPSDPVVCRDIVTGALDVLTMTEGPLQVVGEVQDGRVHFSLSGAYHSFGELHPSQIQGHVEEYTSIDGVPKIYEIGSFALTRE